MILKRYLHKIKNRISYYSFLIENHNKEKFKCPVCGYSGPFMDINPPTGFRKHAKCLKCGSLERHRLQSLVLSNLLNGINTSSLKMLHFAPENFFRDFFSKRFGQYETADLCMDGVDHKVDLQKLPFDDQTYDFVFASDVLEHIPDDKKALSEIRRILKPNSIAVLPVPVVAEKTIEYPEPVPAEAYHVRAPGLDYFDRYSMFFSKVEQFSSNSLSELHQLYTYEDRSQWPTKECPLRPAMQGERHINIVPVCYV